MQGYKASGLGSVIHVGVQGLIIARVLRMTQMGKVTATDVNKCDCEKDSFHISI